MAANPSNCRRLKSAEYDQDQDDDQQKPNSTIQAMAKPISRATTDSGKATQQEDDENDKQNSTN